MRCHRSLLHGLVLAVSLALIVDQYFFTRASSTTYVDSRVLRERHEGIAYSRWRRWSDRNERRKRSVTFDHWYVAHLANGSWFQLEERDNGILRHGDKLTIDLACITGRVLRFRPHHEVRERNTADSYEDLVPFLFLLAPLSLWLLVPGRNADTRDHLHYLLIVVGSAFLIALFAESYPMMKALDLVPFSLHDRIP